MMNRMRKLWKWLLGAAALLLVVALLPLAAIAFPYPFFPHKTSIDNFTVYTDAAPGPELPLQIEDARRRIQAMDLYQGDVDHRVFLCRKKKTYTLFARLTRKNPQTLGFDVTLVGNMFLSEERLREFSEANRAGIRHCRYEGSLGEAIAHEVAHEQAGKALGFFPHLKLPVWKTEGWAEYQANIAATRDDPAYRFPDRVALVLDDASWCHRNSIASRNLYKWHVLVEFLGDVRGYRLEDLVREEVTEDAAWQDLMLWYEGLEEESRG